MFACAMARPVANGYNTYSVAARAHQAAGEHAHLLSAIRWDSMLLMPIVPLRTYDSA
jgi:hypothetical protein